MQRTLQSRISKWAIAVLIFPVLALPTDGSSCQLYATSFGEVPQPVNISLVALLAAPQQYHNQRVRTLGFLCVEFEGDALYLHEEDYRYGLTKNSFALRLSESQRRDFKRLSLKYVLIEGTVDANGMERSDIWSGAIGNLTRLEIWPVDRQRKR